MEITIIGWIVLALSIYGFIKSEKFLLYVAVFFSTFTAASVINIEKTVTGIAPFYVAAGLWMLKVIIKFFKEKNKITKANILKIIKENKLIKALLIFSFVIILGEIFILITGKQINFIDLNTSENILIIFTGSNITQPIYLLFMCVFAMILTLKLKSKEEIKKVIKVFSISTIFALVWGIAQFCMFYLNIEYPAYLFNNNIAALQLHFQMVYGIKRISSIALEPSTFAINILQFFPLAMTLWLANIKIAKTRKKSNIILISIIGLTLISGILTTSSTAYVGIALTILILTIYILIFSIKGKELRNNKKRLILLYLIGIISLICVLILVVKVFNVYWGTLVDTFRDMTINKKNLESGELRGNAIKMSMEIFRQSPILGAGFGSFRSLDTITNLLANTGLLGIISFGYIIYVCIKAAINYRKKDEVGSVVLAIMLIIPTIGLCISIPDLVFGYYWMMIVVVYNYCTDNKEEA